MRSKLLAVTLFMVASCQPAKSNETIVERAVLVANQALDKALVDGDTAALERLYGCCTPPRAAYELKRVWPEVELNIVPDGGHLYNERGILDGLIRATDRFAG